MASTYLSRTFQSGGNRKKWTMSMWVKRSAISSSDENMLFQSYVSTYTYCPIDTNDRLHFQDGNGGTKTTSMKFRDANAWYHIVVAIDTDNSTADDRYKIYVNGERITAFHTSSNPSSGYEGEWNKAQLHNIGRHSQNQSYFNGLMSHIHFCDGYQYQASDFGETDSTTGEWKIKTSPSVSYGTTGFFILKDGNSVTDQSPNTNNFTVGGSTLTKTEDCPSNVFCVWNQNAKLNSTITLTNGNTQAYSSNTSWRSLTGTLGASSGKFYYEAKPITHDYSVHGWISDNLINSTTDGGFAFDQDYSYGYKTYSGTVVYRESSGGGTTSYGANIDPNDVLGCAIDIDNSKAYWSKNGVWLNSADPTNGTNGFSIQSGQTYVPAIAIRNNGASPTAQLNFGNGYFGTTAVSSAGTNASGIGIFEYDVPTGFTALSTKGLNT